MSVQRVIGGHDGDPEGRHEEVDEEEGGERAQGHES